jgi:predicted AlkP superfamily phosphohydrolase/phosphomutase
MVYFDNLYWRSAGTIGHKSLYLSENDTGPDDSVHWYDGVFILYNKSKGNGGVMLNRLSIYDVAPTVLEIMGLEPADGMEGKVIDEAVNYVNGVKVR